jgi:hypothetical protein
MIREGRFGKIWNEAVVGRSRYNLDIYVEGLRRTMEYISRDSWHVGRDKNQALYLTEVKNITDWAEVLCMYVCNWGNEFPEAKQIFFCFCV